MPDSLARSVEGILWGLGINLSDSNTYTLLWIAIITAAVLLALKIFLYLTYRSSYSVFMLSAKKLTKKTDIKKTASLILNKTVEEYISIAEKGVSSDMLVKIADKNVSDLRFIGLSLFNLSATVAGIENAFPVLGVLVLLTVEQSFGIFIVIAALFIFLKLTDIFLSVRNLKDVFAVELTKYVAAQIGQFYSSDIGVSIANFKTTMEKTMKDAVTEQSKSLNESITKLGTDLVGVMRLLSSELTTSVNQSMDGISKIADSTKAPIASYKEAMHQAEIVQTRINEASTSLLASMKSLETAASTFTVGVREYYDKNEDTETATSQNLSRFTNAIASVESGIGALLEMTGSLSTQVSYTEKNQQLLEISVQKYQATLEKISVELANAFTKMVTAESASFGTQLTSKMSEAIQEQMDRNYEMLQQLTGLFDQLSKQSQTELQTLIHMKEQFDINFESLKEN